VVRDVVLRLGMWATLPGRAPKKETPVGLYHHHRHRPGHVEGAAKDPGKYDLLRVRMGGWTEFVIAMFPDHQRQHQRRPVSTPG